MRMRSSVVHWWDIRWHTHILHHYHPSHWLVLARGEWPLLSLLIVRLSVRYELDYRVRCDSSHTAYINIMGTSGKKNQCIWQTQLFQSNNTKWWPLFRHPLLWKSFKIAITLKHWPDLLNFADQHRDQKGLFICNPSRTITKSAIH